VTKVCNKLYVTAKMTERTLKLVGIRAPDLAAIVPMLLYDADYLIDISPNESRDRHWPAVKPLPGIARLHVP
jgi:hypothetical protein